MFVKDMGFKVSDVLVCQLAAVHGLDLVLHDVAVLLDVVLLVQLLAEGHDVLSRDVGVGVELRTRSRVRGGDVIPDEVTLLSQVDSCIKLLNVGYGHLLVDAHQAFFYLSPNFTACDLVVSVEVFGNRNDHRLWTFFAGRFVGLTNAIH